MGLSKRRFDHDFVKCLATLESLAKSRGQLSGNFGGTNLSMINTIVDSYTNSMKAIISMGAHVITHTELDKVVELSTAFGKAAHKRFGDLLVVIFNSWKASFNEALAAESDREVYLASTLEYWTSVQSRLQENSYKTAALQLDDLIDDALLQLHYAAQTVEQDGSNTQNNPDVVREEKSGTSISEADGADDGKDGVTDEA